LKKEIQIKQFQAWEFWYYHEGLTSSFPQSSALKKEIQIKQFQASLIVLFGFLFIRDHGGI
jgi:hypothetical protein